MSYQFLNNINCRALDEDGLSFHRILAPSRTNRQCKWGDDNTDRLNSRELRRLKLRRERRERKQISKLNLF